MPTVSIPNRTEGSTAPNAAAAPRLRYRLDVLGADAGDVVRAAGGWLFDRAMAGWVVGVWLADTSDMRPLTVLGARVYRLEDGPMPAADHEVVAGLAVAGGLAATRHTVRTRVGDALRTGSTEVVLWGESYPDLLGGRPTAVRYQPSVAAQAFKRQALIASGCSDPSVQGETLLCGGYRPPDSDLVPTAS